MQRELDAAILELGASTDRDRIFDCFFEYACALFEFSVLFAVRADIAHGRNVHGLGAPPGLVTRLALPLIEPGILSRARTTRKAFIAPGPSEESDHRLFGNLGRALPAPLVVPLTVRDRVVAIFIADTPSSVAMEKAAHALRPAMDVARDEVILLAESVGQVLERLIIRRKIADSVPPPARANSSAPDARGTAQQPVTIPPLPPLRMSLSSTGVEPPPREAEHDTRRPRPGRRLGIGLLVVVGTLSIAAASWLFRRAQAPVGPSVLAGAALRGWPHAVDPVSVIDAARAASGLGPHAQLALLEAEVAESGDVDFSRPVRNSDGIHLRFEMTTDDVQSVVMIDDAGIHPGRRQPRERCGDSVCRAPAPPPPCSIKDVIASSRAAGLEPQDQAFVRYAVDRERSAPGWTVTVPSRGSIRLDERCQLLARERLRPPAVPVDKVPGAPAAVDPMVLIPRARAHTGLEADAMLLELDARGVVAGGHIDLRVEGAGITYVFAEPFGVRRRRWRRVVVNKDGMPVVGDEGDFTSLPVSLHGSALPLPRCTFAQARAYLTRGVPGIETAHMTYGPDIASEQAGQWSLDMGALASRRVVGDVDCNAWAKVSVRK